MKKINQYLIIVLGIVTINFSVIAKAQVVEKKQDVEVIEITGTIPPSILLKQANQKRYDFYEAFNALNEIDEYKVICERKETTGTRFRKKQCETVYYREKVKEITKTQALDLFVASNRRRIGEVSNVTQQAFLQTEKTRIEAAEYMIDLIEKNPALRAKYDEYIQALEKYEANKKK